MGFKEELLLSVKMVDDGFKSGMTGLSGAMDGFSKTIVTVNQGLGILKTAFGAIEGVASSTINLLGSFVREAAADEQALKRFEASVQSTGTSLEANAGKVKEFQDRMWEMARATDDEAISVLTDLNFITQDLNKSMETAPVAFEMAASGMFTLDEATVALGRSLQGEIGRLGMMYPELKKFSEAQLKAGAAVDYFNEKFAGQAALATYNREIKTFTSLLGEIKSTLGEGMENAITPKLREFNTALFELNKSDELAEISRLLGSIATNGLERIGEAMGMKFDGKSLTDVFTELLTKIDQYTSNPELADDLHNIASGLLGVGKAAAAAADAFLKLIGIWQSLPDWAKSALAAGVPIATIATGAMMGSAGTVATGVAAAGAGAAYTYSQYAGNLKGGGAPGTFVPGQTLGRDHVMVPMDGGEYVWSNWAVDAFGRENLARFNAEHTPGVSGAGLLGGGDAEKWIGIFTRLFGGSGTYETGKWTGARINATFGFTNALKSLQSMAPAQLYWYAKQFIETNERYGSIDRAMPITGQSEPPSNMWKWLMNYAQRNSTQAERTNAKTGINEAAFQAYAAGGAAQSILTGMAANVSQTDWSNPLYSMGTIGGKPPETTAGKTNQAGWGVYDPAEFGTSARGYDSPETFLETIAAMAKGSGVSTYRTPEEWRAMAKGKSGEGASWSIGDLVFTENSKGQYIVTNKGKSRLPGTTTPQTLKVTTDPNKRGKWGITNIDEFGSELDTKYFDFGSSLDALKDMGITGGSGAELNALPWYYFWLHSSEQTMAGKARRAKARQEFLKFYAELQNRYYVGGQYYGPFAGTFHSGGIIPGEFGRERLIMAQEGEEVIPETSPRHIRNIYRGASGSASGAMAFNSRLGMISPPGAIQDADPFFSGDLRRNGAMFRGDGSSSSGSAWMDRGRSRTGPLPAPAGGAIPTGSSGATVIVSSDNKALAEHIRRVIQAGIDVDIVALNDRLQEVRQ